MQGTCWEPLSNHHQASVPFVSINCLSSKKKPPSTVVPGSRYISKVEGVRGGSGRRSHLCYSIINYHLLGLSSQRRMETVTATKSRGPSHRSLKKTAYNLMLNLHTENVLAADWWNSSSWTYICQHNNKNQVCSLPVFVFTCLQSPCV